jgi:hypothetical protein
MMSETIKAPLKNLNAHKPYPLPNNLRKKRIFLLASYVFLLIAAMKSEDDTTEKAYSSKLFQKVTVNT